MRNLWDQAVRAHTAVSMLESIHRQLEQVYTESAKGEENDILTDLGIARAAVERAQQRQLRAFDAAKKSFTRSPIDGKATK